MLPPRTSLDPQGFYARLGIGPEADQASIVAAFRAKARQLHPDVADTGNAAAFVAVKQAYDVLSNHERRGEYDREAREQWTDLNRPRRETAVEPIDTHAFGMHPAVLRAASVLARQRWNVPVMAWLGLGAFLCLCVYQAAAHLMIPARVMSAGIRPNAAKVEPLSPAEHRAVLYGPTPVRLAGEPNFYVVPAAGPAILLRYDPQRNGLVPLWQLPPFSAVQVVGPSRQAGLSEVIVGEGRTGFISAHRLTAGNATAARVAYCSYNAGTPPSNGELLLRRGSGNGRLAVINRAMQPAVVKLRNATGAVVVGVFLGPGGTVDLDGLPEGRYRPDFAFGELWSRACNIFAAGMRARRMDASVSLPGDSTVVVAADGSGPAGADLSDRAFEQQ